VQNLIEALEAVLPQTQCGQCGFEGCTPYAQALAAGNAECDRCPPGGDVVAAALARLLDVRALPFDRARGDQLPPRIAVIREAECIGCTKCIQACPIDAIVGAAERMHTVMLDACSGCALCLPVCPVDCIDLVQLPDPASENHRDPVAAARAHRDPHADLWRRRHDARATRLDARRHQRVVRLEAQSALAQKPGSGLPQAVMAALARAAQQTAIKTGDASAAPSNGAQPAPDKSG